jgi:hypothetical protein
MEDRELLTGFLHGSLDPASFRHADHVRVAWLVLSRHPGGEAIERVSEGIRRLAHAAKRPGLYHETVTWAYLLLIRERMARMAPGHTWAEFADANADLLRRNPDVLDRYYRKDTLESPLARTCFVLPDKALSPPAEVL